MERLFVVVEHTLQHREKRFIGDANLNQSVNDPSFWTDVPLVGEGVAFEHREEVGNGEHGFAEIEPGSERAYFFGYDFVGLWGVRGCGGARDGLLMEAVEEVLPCDADVCGVAMVCHLVNEDAEIIIGCLISVLIVKLVVGVSQQILEGAREYDLRRSLGVEGR